MPKYNERRSCPKCGCTAVGSKYQDFPEAIIRNCGNCGYRWQEEPLDATEGKPEA